MSDRRAVIATVATASALCLASFLTARADAYVYWTNAGTNTIGRANLDGTNVDQSFITGASAPVGIAVDARHIYWTNNRTNTIGRANLDGTNVDQSFITGADDPHRLGGVAVDAGHVYWANVFVSAGGGSIGRADLDGTNIDQRFLAPGDSGFVVGGVAVDAGHIYWTDFFRIARANLDATGGTFLQRGAILLAGEGLAAGPEALYWTTDRGVARSDLDGGNADQAFISGAFDPDGVAVDTDHVYWTNSLAGTSANGIGRADLNGTNADQAFISGASDPVGVAVDGLPIPTPLDATPPQTTINKKPRNRTAKSRVRFRFTSDDLGASFECRLDATPFAPCSSPTTLRRLDRGVHYFKVRATDPAGNVDLSAAKDRFHVTGG